MDPPKRHYKAILPANASPPSTLSLPPPSSSADLVPRARKSPLPTLKGTSSNDRVSDFVRNLVLILQEPSFQDIISWGEQGDCVVIKRADEFAKTVLPRVYKHQNFASFVRQLNKYDFHKVKTAEEKSVTFHHPDFRLDRLDALDGIKRKSSVTRRFSTSEHFLVDPSTIASTSAVPVRLTDVAALQSQIADISQSQNDMASHIRALDHKYRNVLAEFVGFQRNFAQQDGLMHDLMRHLLRNRLEPAREIGPAPDAISDPSPFVRQYELGDVHDPQRVTHTSLRQLNESSWLSTGDLDWTVTGTSRDSASALKAFIEETPDYYDSRMADTLRRIEDSRGMGRMGSNNPVLSYLPGQQTEGDEAEFEDDEMVMPTIPLNLSPESSSNGSVPMESANTAVLSFSEHSFARNDSSSSWTDENTYGELQTYPLGHLVMKGVNEDDSATLLSFDATMSPGLSNTGSSTTSFDIVMDSPYHDSLETDAPWLADLGPSDKRMMEDENLNAFRKRAKLYL